MKILLIGNGARENAIFNALKSSRHNPEIVVFGKAKNPAMLSADFYEIGNFEDMDQVHALAKKHMPDLAIIGPDNPIGLGAADVLRDLNIKTFAPLKTLARLESSKSFTRDLLAKYNIVGNPRFKVFTDQSSDQEMTDYMQTELEGEYVIKFDGLLGGKGVKLSGEHLATIQDGLAFAKECIQESQKVLIEEKFIGPEFSLISFADGKSLAPTPVIQDHKRAYNGDIGPNTGGMGTYSDANHLLPFVTQKDQQEALAITEQVQKALKLETGFDYCGLMYGGFIITKNGVRLIEFNARFGDPEAMNIMPLLETDFVDIVLACVDQKLDQIKVESKPKASVCLYVVPSNYPDGEPLTEEEKLITVQKNILNTPGLYTFFASVDLVEDRDTEYLLKMSSSRALAFTALADTIEEARQIAVQGIQSVSGKIAFRSDIGSSELIQKRIDLVDTFKA
jgi:phosphoribosylamine--glycine ligase